MAGRCHRWALATPAWGQTWRPYAYCVRGCGRVVRRVVVSRGGLVVDDEGMPVCHGGVGRLAGRRRQTMIGRLRQRDGNWCFYCSIWFPPSIEPTLDHRIPRSRWRRPGSPNQIENLVLACEWCNQTKADLTEEEWLADPRLFERRRDVERAHGALGPRGRGGDGVTDPVPANPDGPAVRNVVYNPRAHSLAQVVAAKGDDGYALVRIVPVHATEAVAVFEYMVPHRVLLTPDDRAVPTGQRWKEDGVMWSTCAGCGVPIFRQESWSHQGGTPPTDHDAEPT